ncbi:MAG: hypothetical protein EHM41_17030 [Chloroflexi bacterium]|nr:MAG: hypothetical protein EHM41_17030 [Chloroflexota bacterium]
MENNVQEPKSEADELIPPGCSLFVSWIIVNTAGLGLGWLLGWWISFLTPALVSPAVIGGVTGLIQGGFGWIVLQSHKKNLFWWIPVTVAGWAIGFTTGTLVAQSLGVSEVGFGLVTGAVTGTVLGTAQWLVLQKSMKRAFWWIPASIFALTSAFMFYRPNLSPWGFVYGMMYGIVTSVALLWLIYAE